MDGTSRRPSDLCLLKERKLGTPLAGFGERVWLRDPVPERANKFNPRCKETRLLGFCLKSSRYIVVDFDGRFRMVRTVKRASVDDRWKIVSPRDPFSGADLESKPAEFSCSRGTRGEVNPAAQRLERHPVDALRQTQTPIQFRGDSTSSRVYGTSDRWALISDQHVHPSLRYPRLSSKCLIK